MYPLLYQCHYLPCVNCLDASNHIKVAFIKYSYSFWICAHFPFSLATENALLISSLVSFVIPRVITVRPYSRTRRFSLPVIIITTKTTTLFQEDNILGTNVSLAYGPQLQTEWYYWWMRNCKLCTVCTEQMMSKYEISRLPHTVRECN